MVSKRSRASQRPAKDTNLLGPDRTNIPAGAAAKHSTIDRLMGCSIKRVPIEQLRVAERHARRHSSAKVNALAASIRRFGTVEPLLIEQDGTIISGVARWLALRALGVFHVPTITVSHLSKAEVRALRIAVGRFPDWADWDRDQLRIELPEIIAELPDLAMEEIGFSVPEADAIIFSSAPEREPDPADEIPVAEAAVPIVSRLGDLWQLGEHRLFCGDALDSASYDQLLDNKAIRLLLTDPPYNVPINGHVTKRRGRFAEFAMASGELTEKEFGAFLNTAFRRIEKVSTAGAIGYIFIDWRHALTMQEAASGVFCELKNHIVWVKDAPALGTFYRSQHEFLLVYKIAKGKHVNNFELGQHGRTRSNVWNYPGMSSFGAGRNEALGLHATPKPVAMLIDAILDCSNPSDLVLDPFGGSGSTLIAAERTHRRARLIEISPTYVDTIIRRWQKLTGDEARLAHTGQTFAATASERCGGDVTSDAAVATRSKHTSQSTSSSARGGEGD